MTEKHKVLRLIKEKRGGILRLLFSRLMLIILLILLQIALLLAVYIWLQEHLPWLVTAQAVFTVVMVLYLFNNDMDSTAKLSWMILIVLFPVPGAIFLAYTKSNLGHRLLTEQMQQVIDATRESLTQSPEVIGELADDGSGTDDLWRYINRSGCMPVYTGTEVRYFPSGEAAFPAMLEELEKAETYIFLEYFIIEEGYMWGRILELLARKAKEGVDVRVMYDGMCELSLLPHDYPKRLGELGIRGKSFSPLTPFLSTHYNYRDHRKILVIDGHTAFNGGVNLADEYINKKERFGYWKDTAVMLKGPAAESFSLMFLQMWNVGETERLWPYLPEKGAGNLQTADGKTPAAGYVMPYGDCPLDEDKVGESVYIDMLSRANRYVYIMTPYLVLDGELEAALRYAAERGIDVRLILPGIPDKKAAFALARSHYRALIRAGVRIFEYTPGFVHAKVCISDGLKAVVGTINLDYRSLYHHFECATYLYQTPCLSDIEADVAATLEQCREITMDDVLHAKLRWVLAGVLMKVLAPMW